jgi:hypothetical protein
MGAAVKGAKMVKGRVSRRAAAALAGALTAIVAAGAARAEITALVEEIGDPRPGVQFMDYLSAGQMIPLKAGERFVIDYLKSCVRETITGGVVSIGTEKSIVIGGTVDTEKVECDGGKSVLTAEQASKSGVMVFRSTGPKAAAASAASGSSAPLTIYGASPIIELKTGGQLVIERIDRAGERHVAEIAGSKRAIFDCAKEGCALTPGGTYRASAGGRSVVFKIAESAKPGARPPVERLVRL